MTVSPATPSPRQRVALRYEHDDHRGDRRAPVRRRGAGDVYATPLDDGTFLASESTMYRLLGERGGTPATFASDADQWASSWMGSRA